MQNLNNTYKQFSCTEDNYSVASIIDNQKQDFKGGSVTFRNEQRLS